MATRLPDLTEAELERRLEHAGCSLSRPLLEMLHLHYLELQRWAVRLALVGSGEGPAIVERHYVESLRALSLVDDAKTILDLGSGAGFPGCVIAAARPDLAVWLFEARSRKAAFLRAASARAQLSCRIVNARVSRRHGVTKTVPNGTIDLVTVRGVRIDRDTWEGLEPGLAPDARVLRWEGAAAVEPWPGARAGRVVGLDGLGRKIREWVCLPRPATKP